jgi:hypothetical protein
VGRKRMLVADRGVKIQSSRRDDIRLAYLKEYIDGQGKKIRRMSPKRTGLCN